MKNLFEIISFFGSFQKIFFPQSDTLIPYSNLIKKSEETFSEIFDFIEIDSKSSLFKKCFKEALELSKSENIKSLEKSRERHYIRQERSSI